MAQENDLYAKYIIFNATLLVTLEIKMIFSGKPTSTYAHLVYLLYCHISVYLIPIYFSVLPTVPDMVTYLPDQPWLQCLLFASKITHTVKGICICVCESVCTNL